MISSSSILSQIRRICGLPLVIVATLLSLSQLLSSCSKKFLDVPDPSTLLRQAYVTDLNKTADAMDGIYILLAQNLFHGYNQIYPDLVADNIKPVKATTVALNTQYNWSQLATTETTRSKSMNVMWLDGYQIISYCNFVVAKSEEYRSQNPTNADDIKAQALVIRAFVHFILVNVFAQSYSFTPNASHLGIPYVTNYDWTQPTAKRNTVDDVYNNMISDLKKALLLFPSRKINSKLYMNRDAAKAILARIYLFNGDYRSAQSLAGELSVNIPIMEAGPTGYPSQLFTLNETEAFFQMAPSTYGILLPSPTGSYQGSYYTYFQGSYFGTSKNFIATNDIVTELSQNASDLRKGWVLSTGEIVKYPSNVVPNTNYKSGSYYPTMIRSSEMYLTTSEAFSQLKNDDSARYYLNKIRMRANITLVADSIKGIALLDSIYVERRRELAFEGLRMFDLQRWKKGVNRKDAWSASVKSLPYPSNKAVAPIPKTDVQMLGLTQNLDY